MDGWIGVLHRHHHVPHSRLDDPFRAGRRLLGMGNAGFQVDIERGALRPGSRFLQNFAQNAVEKARHHPFAVGMNRHKTE